MTVTIKDVSKDAAVSIKTVSRVINNEANVAKSTKEKVLASVKKLGFKPNKSAQSLRSKKSYMLALLYDNPNKSYLADVQSGIFNACKSTGYNLVIQECDYKSNELKTDIVKFVEDFRIDGLIVTPPLSDMEDFLQNLDNHEIEYSVIAPSTRKPESLHVSSNDYEAAYSLTSEIIKHGHKDIGFIKGHPKHSASHLRFNGFVDAMAKQLVAWSLCSSPPRPPQATNDFVRSVKDSLRKQLQNASVKSNVRCKFVEKQAKHIASGGFQDLPPLALFAPTADSKTCGP